MKKQLLRNLQQLVFTISLEKKEAETTIIGVPASALRPRKHLKDKPKKKKGVADA